MAAICGIVLPFLFAKISCFVSIAVSFTFQTSRTLRVEHSLVILPSSFLEKAHLKSVEYEILSTDHLATQVHKVVDEGSTKSYL